MAHTDKPVYITGATYYSKGKEIPVFCPLEVPVLLSSLSLNDFTLEMSIANRKDACNLVDFFY